MNTNEIKEIDAAQEIAEKQALIREAVDNDPCFYSFLHGWMETRHLDEMAEAAEAWLNTHKR
jgi:hypothetical protein